MPRMQLLLHRVWPLRTPSLSERFPLRPRGSLIFGGVRATFFFLKRNHLLSPTFQNLCSQACPLPLPLPPPSTPRARPIFSFSLSGSHWGSQHLYPEGRPQPPKYLSLLHTHSPLLGRLALFICPLWSPTQQKWSVCIWCWRVYVDVCVCFFIHICLHNMHSVFLAKSNLRHLVIQCSALE